MEKQPFILNEKAADPSEVSEWEVDPVCGMDVDTTDQDVEHVDRNGKTFYFCSSDCRQQFETDHAESGA